MRLIILSQALKVRAAKGVSNSKWNNSEISNRGEVALLTEQQTALCEVSLKILSSFARNFLDKEPLFLFRKQLDLHRWGFDWRGRWAYALSCAGESELSLPQVLLVLRADERIAIWLILPVVICLSQRLSHACLSINRIQWNCEWLIKTVIVYLIIEVYMDNRGNSRANTCIKTRRKKGCIY